MSQPDPTHNPPLDQVELTDGGSHPTATGQGTVSFVPESNSPVPPSSAKTAGSTDANAASQTRYEVHKHLGSGSFGSVSLAWDNQLQREVAIKRPRTGLPAAALQSFLREAQLVARLRHPSVVVVHDVQVTDTGEPFIVYEYLPGQSLRQRLKANEPLPLAEALKIALALAEGLAAAHKLGLTHRDLKPANVLFDAEGRPHIADFGLAIQEGQQRVLKGEIAGTFKYMAPEQVRGEAHQLDGRTDLWALGVILYEMLTGHQPFTGDDPADITDQILHRNPRPPRQWVPEIPKEVEQLVLKLLAKPAGERIGSAGEVAAALVTSLGQLTKLPSTTPALHSSSRHRVLVLGLIGFAVLLAIIAASRSHWDKPSGSLKTDADFEADVWNPLMEVQPRAVAALDESTKLLHAPGEVHINSEYEALFLLGRTSAKNYSYKARISSAKMDGKSGLFLGFAPRSDSPQVNSAILIGLYKDQKGLLLIERQALSQVNLGNQRTYRYDQFPRSTDGVTPNRDSVLLQVDVEDSRISRISIDGRAMSFKGHELDSFKATGGFGIFTLGGSCDFSAPQFRHW